MSDNNALTYVAAFCIGNAIGATLGGAAPGASGSTGLTALEDRQISQILRAGGILGAVAGLGFGGYLAATATAYIATGELIAGLIMFSGVGVIAGMAAPFVLGFVAIGVICGASLAYDGYTGIRSLFQSSKPSINPDSVPQPSTSPGVTLLPKLETKFDPVAGLRKVQHRHIPEHILSRPVM